MDIRAIPQRLWRRLLGLVREMAPPVLFFFIALLAILVIFKLFVAQYTIEFYAFGKAALGAVIIGKGVLLMEWAAGKREIRRLPLAAIVALRTALYAGVVILLWSLERFIDFSRQAKGVKAGASMLLANANLDRFLGLVILASMVIGTYLVLEEISDAMGPGALRKLFFSRPPARPLPAEQLAGAR